MEHGIHFFNQLPSLAEYLYRRWIAVDGCLNTWKHLGGTAAGIKGVWCGAGAKYCDQSSGEQTSHRLPQYTRCAYLRRKKEIDRQRSALRLPFINHKCFLSDFYMGWAGIRLIKQDVTFLSIFCTLLVNLFGPDGIIELS